MQVLGNHQTAGSDLKPLPIPHNRIGPLHLPTTPVAKREFLIIRSSALFPSCANACVCQKILLAVVILDIPLQFGTHLFLRREAEEFGAMGGLASQPRHSFAACMFLVHFRSLTKRNSEERPSVFTSVGPSPVSRLHVMSVFCGSRHELAVFETCLFIESLLLYVYARTAFRTRKDFCSRIRSAGRRLSGALVIITLSFTGMPSAIWGLPTHIHVESVARGGFMRIVAPSDQPIPRRPT